MMLYSLVYNYTKAPWLESTEGHAVLATYESLYWLKISIDNGIINQLKKDKGIEDLKSDPQVIDASISQYPAYKEWSLDGMNMSVLFGGFYFILAPLSVFAILMP